MRIVSDFLLALSFLSRVVPARKADEASLARSISWFCPAGLVIGMIMALPAVPGFLDINPFILSWLIVCLGFFLTRGLHWDGLADVFDAWASRADSERFWTIIKDSHTGAFGAAGLILGIGGQIACISEIAGNGQWLVIVWAVILGRFGAVVLAWWGKNLARPGLGRAFMNGAGSSAVLSNLLMVLVFGALFISFQAVLAAFILLGLGLIALHNLGKSKNGINGDFLGSAIIWGELSGLLSFLIMI